MKPITVGIIAPSSVIPKVELALGIQALRDEGLEIKVHPSVYGQHTFYSATDEARAQAFIEYAQDATLDVIWCARGGYGATHLLPLLKKKLNPKKIKRKLLIGFSDATALLEFARTQLRWKTIHGPMPALKTFSALAPGEWASLLSLIRQFSGHNKKGQNGKNELFPLEWIYRPPPFRPVVGPVVGGNLAVWNSLIGTPFAGSSRGKILFFEEIQENVARINRMIHHLEQAGGFKGAKGIVLGDFTECRDTAPLVFKSVPKDLFHPTPEELMPLRETLDSKQALAMVFKDLGQRLSLPVLAGLPLGHGGRNYSLALGEPYRISLKGKTPCLTLGA